jgi:predicted RNA-binding Zn-ribbon protein involved in translation (DUF1610 family)
MQVIIDHIVEDIQVTTVTLAHDITDPTGSRIKMFHCPVCGSPVVQYSGFVARMFPGMEPVTLPIIARCTNTRRCNAKYLFRSIV